MIKLRLPEADRTRLGLPEWIEYDPATLMFTEAEQLQDTFGIDPWDLAKVLQGVPVLGPDGSPVMDGDQPKTRQNLRAWRFVVWVAAKRAGCDIPLSDFDINVLGLVTSATNDGEPADDPKDPSTHEPGSEPESVPSEP